MASSSASSAAGSSAAAAEAAVGAQTYRQCLKMSCSVLLRELGFDSADPSALETLVEMMQSFLCELGRSSRAYCELACRAEPLAADVVLALVEMAGPGIQQIREHAFRSGRKTLGAPGQAQPVKSTSILHTGDRKKNSKSHIQDYFPEMPDSHSYIRTPTHKQPVTDYESVREKASSQKRDVERALTRFIAKTGKTHSLFNTDDTNLYPLISCDRVMADAAASASAAAAPLPTYINALLFKDQIFDEDEREYKQQPKKRKTDAEEIKADNDDDADGDDSSGGGGGGGAKKKSEESSPVATTNPYLRPVKKPRAAVATAANKSR